MRKMERGMELEYESLRSEIADKLRLQNDLLVAAVTASVAVLAFIAESDYPQPWMYSLPLFVLVPFSRRIAYYRSAVAKISAYITVFIEGNQASKSCRDCPQWETRNSSLIIDAPHRVNPAHGMPRKGLELFWLGMMYAAVYTGVSINCVVSELAWQDPDSRVFSTIILLVPLGLACFVAVWLLWRYSPYCHPMAEVRAAWMDDWTRVKENEDADNQTCS